MNDPSNPLDANHLSQINSMQERIRLAEVAIERAKLAQIPGVAAQEQELIRSKEQLARIKNVYFPNG